MIRNKTVFSITDQRLKEWQLREPNLALDKTIDICRAAEIAHFQMQAMDDDKLQQNGAIAAIQQKQTHGPNTAIVFLKPINLLMATCQHVIWIVIDPSNEAAVVNKLCYDLIFDLYK